MIRTPFALACLLCAACPGDPTHPPPTLPPAPTDTGTDTSTDTGDGDGDGDLDPDQAAEGHGWGSTSGN